MLSLVLAALFFAGIHLGIAGTAIRDRAIGLLGKTGYMAAFAIASLIGIAPAQRPIRTRARAWLLARRNPLAKLRRELAYHPIPLLGQTPAL